MQSPAVAHAAAARLFAATAVRLTVGSCAHAIARLRRSGARASDSTRGEGPCCASHARYVYASVWLLGRAGVLAECGRQPSDRQQSEHIRHARPARRRRRDQVLTRTIGCPTATARPRPAELSCSSLGMRSSCTALRCGAGCSGAHSRSPRPKRSSRCAPTHLMRWATNGLAAIALRRIGSDRSAKRLRPTGFVCLFVCLFVC